jgi:MoaA/NifB/PqqE/SkfB family radical SAM enzyme
MLGILPPKKSRCLSAKASTSGVAGERKDCERQKSPLVLSSEDDENVGMPLAPVAARNNLGTFGTTIPPYMPSELVGPPVVPCYVGWYFSVILGNGSVMPCCQCAAPIGQVTKVRRFAEVWASREYQGFRTAARSLPEKSDRLKSCECDNCQLRLRNVAIHNLLHPLNQIQAGQEVKFYSRNLLGRLRGKRVLS